MSFDDLEEIEERIELEDETYEAGRKQGALKELRKQVRELKGIEKIIYSENKNSNGFYAINSLIITKEKRIKELEEGVEK